MTGLTQISGALYLYNEAQIATAGSLANGGTISLDQYGGDGGAGLTVGGVLINSGNIQVGSGNNALSANDTISAASVNNTGGTVNLYGSSTATAEIDVTGSQAASLGASPGVLAGQVNLNGAAKIVFTSGEITAIAASGQLLLDGSSASIQDGANGTNNNALAGLVSNAGQLLLETEVRLQPLPVGPIPIILTSTPMALAVKAAAVSTLAAF